MQRDDYTAANREAWNEAAPRHAKATFADLEAHFTRPGYSCLDATATGILNEIGVAGKAVAHPCCNNGRELLSMKNMGAGRCVGFDISDAFIEQARALAAAGGIDCSFVRTNLYDIGTEFDGVFDLVVFTVGGLTWMPDLDACFRFVTRLLQPNGVLFIYDMHPTLEMFEEDDRDPMMVVRNSYFKTTPFVEVDGLDYYSHEQYEAKPAYSFVHKLSDTITACLNHGLAIRAFTEYDHDIGNRLSHFEESDVRPPMSFTLVAQKTA